MDFGVVKMAKPANIQLPEIVVMVRNSLGRAAHFAGLALKPPLTDGLCNGLMGGGYLGEFLAVPLGSRGRGAGIIRTVLSGTLGVLFTPLRAIEGHTSPAWTANRPVRPEAKLGHLFGLATFAASKKDGGSLATPASFNGSRVDSGRNDTPLTMSRNMDRGLPPMRSPSAPRSIFLVTIDGVRVHLPPAHAARSGSARANSPKAKTMIQSLLSEREVMRQSSQ